MQRFYSGQEHHTTKGSTWKEGAEGAQREPKRLTQRKTGKPQRPNFGRIYVGRLHNIWRMIWRDRHVLATTSLFVATTGARRGGTRHFVVVRRRGDGAAVEKAAERGVAWLRSRGVVDGARRPQAFADGAQAWPDGLLDVGRVDGFTPLLATPAHHEVFVLSSDTLARFLGVCKQRQLLVKPNDCVPSEASSNNAHMVCQDVLSPSKYQTPSVDHSPR